MTQEQFDSRLEQCRTRALILAQHQQLLSRETEIEHLQLLIAKLQHMQFGRKSEERKRQYSARQSDRGPTASAG